MDKFKRIVALLLFSAMTINAVTVNADIDFVENSETYSQEQDNIEYKDEISDSISETAISEENADTSADDSENADTSAGDSENAEEIILDETNSEEVSVEVESEIIPSSSDEYINDFSDISEIDTSK